MAPKRTEAKTIGERRFTPLVLRAEAGFMRTCDTLHISTRRETATRRNTAQAKALYRGAGDEGTEEGEGHERSGADGEALADGSSGVARGVERVRLVAHARRKLDHLGDAASIVRDRPCTR